MKADPFAQLKLLDVQALDSRADHLRHQRSHLPESVEIAKLTASRTELVDLARDQQIIVDDLSAAQRKADVDVEQVKTRRVRDQDRIDQGQVSNPKDLERMQHELASLDRRITTLEDEELEVMEQVEEAQTRLAQLQVQVGEADERLATLIAERDRRTAEIDAELSGITAERSPMVADVPAELLALYEKLRESKDGVGAAELRARQCGGCRLTLDMSEISQIGSSPSDLVIRCEECQRILVRTSESGL